MKVLMIDDDLELCELVQQSLVRDGFDVHTEHAGQAGVAQAVEREFDLVVLDVMLPDGDGFEMLQRLRLRSDVPVIMLTAKGDEADRIRGFEFGADDYVAKPFSPVELMARMKAIVRRAGKTQAVDLIEIAGVSFNPARNEAEVGGATVSLTGVEAAVLRLLMSRAGEPVTREHLYKTVLNREPSPHDRSLDNHVSNLRKKLGPDDKGVQRIFSVRGVGYQFAP